MSSDIEELAREGMRQFTATMQVSPDLAARTFERHRQQRRRHIMRAGLALGAAGAVTAAAVIAAVAHRPATNIAAPALRARLLAAIDTASGDILYTPAPGGPLVGGQYPAFPRPGQEVHVRIGPAAGSDGKVYKDGEYSFTMPSQTALRDYINHYTANVDPGGLHLSGTAMWIDHFTHTWGERHSKFILGFTLDAAGIRAEIANGQFTVIGRTKLNGQQAIELKINVLPSSEAPPHMTAERMWVNATTYLPMREYVRMSNGQQSVFDYVFLPPTPENLAKLRPTIPAGYTRSSAPAPRPHICRSTMPPETKDELTTFATAKSQVAGPLRRPSRLSALVRLAGKSFARVAPKLAPRVAVCCCWLSPPCHDLGRPNRISSSGHGGSDRSAWTNVLDRFSLDHCHRDTRR